MGPRRSLRGRILWLTAASAAGVAVLVAGTTVAVAAFILNHQVDEDLRQAVEAPGFDRGGRPGGPGPTDIDADGDRSGIPGSLFRRDGNPSRDGGIGVRLISPTRVLSSEAFLAAVPISAGSAAVASGASPDHMGEMEIAGRRYRTYAVPFVGLPGAALEAFRSTEDIDRSLLVLTIAAGSVAVFGIVVATGGAWLVARSAVHPVETIASAAEHVAATADLSITVPVAGGVELEGLARSMNTMLAALDASHVQQRQLIADAGHELRTPITSIRTNLELLAAHPTMGDEDRQAIFSDVTAQLEEFGLLVSDVTALARDDSAALPERTTVRLDVVVERAAKRARRRALGVTVEVTTTPATLEGEAPLLERAVLNVLDNAIKWSPADGVVRVSQLAGRIVIDDQGPGIDVADRSHVFDRFWRSPAARSTPGSGLGLAIVVQVVASHGGRVGIDAAPGGGARVVIELPVDVPAAPNLS